MVRVDREKSASKIKMVGFNLNLKRLIYKSRQDIDGLTFDKFSIFRLRNFIINFMCKQSEVIISNGKGFFGFDHKTK